MSAYLVPPVRDLFAEHPRACRLSPEQVADLLWILRYGPDEKDAPPEPFEVADALKKSRRGEGTGGVRQHIMLRKRPSRPNGSVLSDRWSAA
jgi:hypothetical protein